MPNVPVPVIVPPLSVKVKLTVTVRLVGEFIVRVKVDKAKVPGPPMLPIAIASLLPRVSV
jgi:hypothetical protein